MNLILHIGIEKTGTSFIQTFLYENKMALEDSGYAYLHTGGRVDHRDVCVAFMSALKSDDYTKSHKIEGEDVRRLYSEKVKLRLRDEINSFRSRGIHTCVISSEHLSSRTVSMEEISSLKAFFKDLVNDIRVVAYIRDQCKKATSLYSTHIKTGKTCTFKTFLEQYPKDYYDRMFLPWEGVFGKDILYIKIFDKNIFVDDDLIKDFLDLSEIQIDQNNLIYPTSNNNITLDKISCKILRLVNFFLPKNNLKSNDVRESFIKKLNMLQGRPLSLTHEESQAINERFQKSNEEFRKKYFPNKDSLFE